MWPLICIQKTLKSNNNNNEQLVCYKFGEKMPIDRPRSYSYDRFYVKCAFNCREHPEFGQPRYCALARSLIADVGVTITTFVEINGGGNWQTETANLWFDFYWNL